MQEYARTWFSVKAKPHFYQAPIYIYNMINNTKIINRDRIINILLKSLIITHMHYIVKI